MKRTNQITLEGRNMVRDALQSNQEITGVTISTASRNEPRIREIEVLATNRQIPIQWLKPDELQKLSESYNPQGVIAFMKTPDEVTLVEILNNRKSPFIILFNTLDYEQNLGAILRSAWAAGVDAVVVNPSGVNEITPVVAKISMGGAAYVPVISQSLFQALKTIKDYAIPVVGVEVDKGAVYTDAKLTGGIALLFGGEAAGITEPLTKYCDSLINIPMNTEVASLNVSVATALVLFEKRRQERA